MSLKYEPEKPEQRALLQDSAPRIACRCLASLAIAGRRMHAATSYLLSREFATERREAQERASSLLSLQVLEGP